MQKDPGALCAGVFRDAPGFGTLGQEAFCPGVAFAQAWSGFQGRFQWSFAVRVTSESVWSGLTR